MNNDEDMIDLNVSNQESENHVTKEEILSFFKDLKTMPIIDKEIVYKQILNDSLNLPNFNFEEYFMEFCKYKDNQNKELVIIRDVRSDSYYYIQNENVFKCSISKAQQVFYGDIAKIKKQKVDDIYDEFTEKISNYEVIFLACQSKHLSNLNDFIEDNIYMFDEAIKEKKLKNKTKIKPH